MSKKRKYITDIILIIAIIFVAVMLFFAVRNKEQPKKDGKEQVVSSDVSSTISIEDIESEETEIKTDSSNTDVSSFIEPDESKADKLLEQNITKSSSNPSSETKTEDSKSEPQKTTENSSEPQSFEDGKKALENKALEYLKQHNIDIKTAGETGETCPNCGKKIWNPDKYGDFIPGMPEDYENSGYCLGTCAISFE